LFALVSLIPLALLYKLMTPTPVPATPLPEPNGFHDLIAAGNMIGRSAAVSLQGWDQLTVPKLRAEIAKHQAAFDRMELGLQRNSRNPYVFQDWPQENLPSLMHLQSALFARNALARRENDVDGQVACNLLLLRLSQEESRGAGADCFGGWFAQYEKDGYTGIWSEVSKLSAEKCAEIIGKLRDLDVRREPWEERVAMQRVIEGNAGWERHLRMILTDWSGEEFEKWGRIEECRRVAQLRMLTIKLALHVYRLEHDRLPANLEELVPRYVAEVPIDPFGGEAFGYKRDGDKYLLYSFGPDGDDDGGAPRTVVEHEELGDMTDTALFEPPVFQPWIGQP
jgi:hypothetical protein